MKRWRTGLLLLLCVTQPLTAKKQDRPEQVSSAHTVAVVTHAAKAGGGRYLGISDPGVAAQLNAEAQEAIRKTPGLAAVADPAQSDLVLLVLAADWKTPYGEDIGLIFPGGAHTDSARTVPLWVGEGQSGFSAVDYFLSESNHQPSKGPGVHIVLPRWRARLRSPSDGAAGAASETVSSGFPDELLRAKSAIVYGYSPETPWGIRLSHPFLRGSLAHALEKWGRFKMVDNPQDADLIFAIYTDEHQESDIHPRRSENYTREALIIFANARTPEVPMPLWMEQVDEKAVWGISVKFDMIHALRQDIERAEKTTH